MRNNQFLIIAGTHTLTVVIIIRHPVVCMFVSVDVKLCEPGQ